MPGRAHWVWRGSESKENRHQCYTVSVGSVNFSLTSYLLQMFCSTMIAVSSKGSPVRAGEEILWENCCVGMTICWAQPVHIQFGSAPHLWVNWIHVCDISPVVLLSPDNLEDITGINDHELLQYERSESLRPLPIRLHRRAVLVVGAGRALSKLMHFFIQ